LAVSIRLRRTGRKKRPFYRVVVAHKSNPMPGKFIDDLGYYDPMGETVEVSINEEKALMWLERGAEPTRTVRNLLSKAGILKKRHEQKYSPHEDKATEEDETQSAEEPESVQEEEP
jgi:small subunit ribosomal protein S16